MKLLFKNKTKYSMENYEKFLEFHQNKYGGKYTFSTIIIILMFLFLIISQIKFKTIIPLCFTIIGLIIFLVYRYYHPRKVIEKEKNSKKVRHSQEFIFKFYEKYFLIYSKKIYTKVKYNRLYKIFETDEFYYLYIDKEHSYLISKNGFEIGTEKEFNKFINKKCKFKVKNKKNKKN